MKLTKSQLVNIISKVIEESQMLQDTTNERNVMGTFIKKAAKGVFEEQINTFDNGTQTVSTYLFNGWGTLSINKRTDGSFTLSIWNEKQPSNDLLVEISKKEIQGIINMVDDLQELINLA